MKALEITSSVKGGSLPRLVQPSRKRKMLWPELSDALKACALAQLRRLAQAKVEYDGTLLPYAWPERIAPLLRYTLTPTRHDIWDCNPAPKDRALGCTIFTLPIPALDAIDRPNSEVSGAGAIAPQQD